MQKLAFSSIVAVLLLFSTISFSQKRGEEPPFTKSNAQAEMYFQQGLKFYDQGDFRQARKAFMQATEKDPLFVSAIIYLANTSQTAKEYADNIRKAETIVEKGTNWDRISLQQLQANLRNDYDAHLTLSQKLVAAYPNLPRAYLELGTTYSSGNETEKAREMYGKAAELAPKNVAAYFSLASSYLFEDPKDFATAEKYAIEAVKLAPTSASVEILLGDVYRAQKDLVRARDAYTAAINLEKAAPEAYYKRGHANTYLGNFSDARKDYLNAGENDETTAYAVQDIAYTYLYDNDSKKAMDELTQEENKLTGKDPVTNNARMNLLNSAAFIALHNNDAAALKMIVSKYEPTAMAIGDELGSSEAIATEKASVLYWKSLLEAINGNYAAAGQMAEEVKNTLQPINNPRKFETYASLMGMLHYKQNKFDLAADDFQKADKTNVYDKYWLARAYEAAGSKDKANSIYKEIADNNFNSVGYALIRNEVKKKAMQ